MVKESRRSNNHIRPLTSRTKKKKRKAQTKRRESASKRRETSIQASNLCMRQKEMVYLGRKSPIFFCPVVQYAQRANNQKRPKEALLSEIGIERYCLQSLYFSHHSAIFRYRKSD